jgi:DNA polymerase elongation subunit (family B)
MKGIALVRRDYCGFVKKCYSEITDEILNNTSTISDTIEIYKKYLKQLEDNKIDITDLTLSSLLKANYKTKPIHVYVSEKMRLRNEEVSIGDRIPFVYIENGNEKKSESGEHPKFVIDKYA